MTTPPAAPTLVANEDADPCPRVEVTVEPGADNQTLTLYRQDAGGSSPVRGGWRIEVSGPALVVDYEVPFGQPVTYFAVGYDADGNASAPGPASQPVTVDSGGCPWVQDPTNPESAARWQVVDWEGMEYGRSATVLRPMLSPTAIAVIGVRQEPESEMVARTTTDSAAAALRALCAVPVLLIRPDPSWGWPARYWLVGDLTETRQAPHTGDDPRRLWTLPLTAVDAPSATLLTFPYVWADVVAYWDTWADLIAGKATWLDVMRDPAPGGAP